MSSLNSARNAMKHGFCSSHFLAEENAEHIRLIRDELVVSHQPETLLQKRLVAELALARFKVFENERLRDKRRVEERLQAGMLFESQLLAEFQTRETAWRESPADALVLMAANKLGHEFLMREWLDLRELLASGKATITLHKACEAALRVGSSWRIEELSAQGRRIFGLFLAMNPLPELQIKQWVKRSGGACPVTDSTVAHEIYAEAPTAEAARREFLELVDDQLGLLEFDQPLIMKSYEAAKLAFIEKSCGLGLSDPARTNEARLFMRYYTADMNRADKLERILVSQQNERQRRRGSSKPQELPNQAEGLTIAQNRSAEAQAEKARQVMEAFERVPAATDPTMQKLLAARNAAVFRKLMEQALPEAPTSVESVPLSIHKSEDAEVEPVLPAKKPFGLLSELNWNDLESVSSLNLSIVKHLATKPDGELRQRLIKLYFGSTEQFDEVLKQVSLQTA